MRTTIDLPDDLHQLARSMSRDLGQSLSSTVALLIRRGLQASSRPSGHASAVRMVDGFPVIVTGRPTTSDDVRRLDDDVLE
ncbi:MAG: antitoxin [Geodermatophilaceae bacterium]|jgi:hypothetical protein|nr:antitoxin [Geodermatophilaceae bacterium]MDQ3457166.1 antitoxin [Actinomycetota bacterium]